MKKEVFGKNVSVEYPDDYYVMGEDEIRKFFASDMPRLSVRNAEKHVILSVSKTNPSFVNLITDAKSVLIGAESAMKKKLKGYECTDRFDAKLLGKNAKGIRFEYSAADMDVRQFCEMTVAKVGMCFYVVYCMARLASSEENADLFTAFRQSIRFI